MLDKNCGIPLYLQVKQILKDSIIRSDYKDGELLPSETRLSAEYSITRQTIRRALSELSQEGFIRKERGKGSFVNIREIKYSIWNFNGFTDYISSIGKTPLSTILNHEITEFSDFGRCLKLTRARGIKTDSNPEYLTIDTSWVPLQMFPGIELYDFSEMSLYKTMREKYSIQPERVEMIIKPIAVGTETLNIFNLKEKEDLLNVTGNVYSHSNRRIERVSVVYSPKLEFHMMTNISR